MNRRQFLATTAAAPLLAEARHPGIFKFTLGTPEQITPVSTRRYAPVSTDSLPGISTAPVTPKGRISKRGYLVTLPLAPNELVYGLGLQLQSFIQRGLKKKLRVNADPKVDSGDSHAPVPFYVTTRGYGVLIDTARYATFYCGNKKRKGIPDEAGSRTGDGFVSPVGLPAAYNRYNFNQPSEVLIEIPEAQGVDVYIFAGPSLREAVQRYNLFSGSGPIPPRWGLGMWYRASQDFTQDEVLKLSAEFRQRRIPCDVIGLEPKWQTHAYSCSYVWSDRFPDPAAMVENLAADHYRLNLWEHAFTHPSSPIYKDLLAHSGDYEVWGGVVPDFLQPEAREIFADFHEKTHVALGVSGYKLDECDNSDFTGNWSFPEFSAFPSGADGEQMHSLFGLRYQDTIQSIFEKRKQPTYGLVRSSGALAAPYPYVLYSDLYDHAEFIKGIAKSGFSGILWTPELRDAKNEEDLIRRLQSVALSPMALINGWYIRNPPWKQIERAANNKDQIDPYWEQLESRCREVMNLRMRLVPYIHSAFIRYHRDGLPPFRALVMDYPQDPQTWTIDDQYMMGDNIIVAPVVAGQHERSVYLPEGDWHDYWTGYRHSGRIQVRAPLERIPIFVRGGTILPLADITLHTDDPASWNLTAMIYSDGAATGTLYEEDGTEVRYTWDGGNFRGAGKRYVITDRKLMRG
ncbi:MAG: glycoside hydrolase family 31 [Bryobacterales bacterium]|nr:glycoside hydrolase family 31 [Bryobacterales bacterium]